MAGGRAYAKALFALAKERNETELIGRELGDAATTFASVAVLDGGLEGQLDRMRHRLASG
jgi:F0F1-type ATP synthase delta subunit